MGRELRRRRDRNGSNIVLVHPGGPVTFVYDHRTNWVTNDLVSDIWAVRRLPERARLRGGRGRHCQAAWLQDPDRDGVYVHRTNQVPAGTWQVKAAANGTLEGPTQSFTVDSGDATTFTYDPATQALTVTTAPTG